MKEAHPLLSWPGGKRRLVHEILPLFPRHEAYVEAFCGALAVFLAKPRSPLEVINDTHNDLVNLYRVVKYHAAEVEKELDFVLNSRADFLAFREQPGLTDIQRAARWLMRRKNCFADDENSFGISKHSGGAVFSSTQGKREAVRLLSRRLDKTNVEHLPWRECVDKYDAPSTLFYFDPPYITGSIKTYRMWKPEQMAELRDRTRTLEGKWVLTTCDSKESRDIFRGCKLRPVVRARGINNKQGTAGTYAELIVTPK